MFEKSKPPSHNILIFNDLSNFAQLSYVYIMSNKHKNVLYIGVTTNLRARVSKHSCGEGSSFTSRYKCYLLIYYETFSAIADAIAREKQLKKWNRLWKMDLIRKINPELRDLTKELW